MLIEALGWAAAAFGSLVALPQVVRLFQTGSAAGVSLTAWQASFGANIAWTVHGVLGGYANLWVPKLICQVEAIPVLGTGKTDLKACRALAIELAGAQAGA